MRRVMIVCRSQTEALRCARLLQGAGIRGVLRKPPRDKWDNSCAWGVRIQSGDLSEAQRRMSEKNFAPARVYEFDDPDEGGQK